MPICKAHILTESQRTAKADKGVPLGRRQFYGETGIKETDWLGRYWARWGDAIAEAGLTPNVLQAGYGEEHLLERLASLARELGRFPGRRDIQLKVRQEQRFPRATTFQRLGLKSELAAKLGKFCEGRADYKDVLALCTPAVISEPPATDRPLGDEFFGHVYLLKSGRFFKIGRTNAVGRRERELAIHQPEKASAVHSIKNG